MPLYAELVYNGYWFSKKRISLQKIIDKNKNKVNGTVVVKVYKGNLTIMRNGVEATEEELKWLFNTIEGFDEWQTEKYAAVGFDVEYSKTMINLLSRPTGLEQFMGV